MKLLFLNNYYYIRGGSERVLFDEMRMLKDAGHDVAIFSRANPHNEKSEYERYFPPPLETESPSISLKTIKTVKDIVYCNEARKGLKKVIEDFKPDVAHAHNIYGRLSLAVLDELNANNIPVVLTLHDLKILCPSYLMLNHGKLCERCNGKKFHNAVFTKCHKDSYLASAIYAFESWFNLTLRKYDTVKYFIAPSKFVLDKCVQYGWDLTKFVYIPNCTDQLNLSVQDQGSNYILYLGRLSPEKGVETLIMACRSLNVKYKLFIAGDGPEKRELERLTGGDPNIRFMGYLRGHALKDVLVNATAVVIPSECYENAPLTVLESFAYGKPVIGAQIGGIPEMIDDGVNGLLFDSGNVADLSDKIKIMLSMSNEELRRMGRSARKKAETEYNRKRHYDKLIEIYQKAIGKT